MEISRRKVIVWGGELKKEIQFDVPDRTVFYQDRDCRRNFFSLNDDLLSRHIVLIGGSGSGKTNVFNLTLDQLRKNHQEQDIFIPENDTGSAMHQDKVQILVRNGHKEGKRQEGVVLKVLERGMPSIVGTYQSSRDYGFVAVAAGEGLKAVFTDLAADAVVSGGQTMNPATEDILAAIQSVPAKTVLVLPNNKNIIMASEQAQKLADRNQLDLLVLRRLCRFFEIQLAADRNAEDKIALLFAPGDERLENLLGWLPDALCGVKTAQVVFIVRIFLRAVSDFRRVEQTHHIRFVHTFAPNRRNYAGLPA